MKRQRPPVFLIVMVTLAGILAIAVGPVGWALLVMAGGPLVIYLVLGGMLHSSNSARDVRRR